MNVKSGFDSTWLKDYGKAHDAPHTLVILPHAGGSASFYLPLATRLAPQVSALVVQYPGRQERRREPGLRDLRETAGQLAESIIDGAAGPVSLLGHSMGALIAYETAHILRDKVFPLERLFVSGRRSPALGSNPLEQNLIGDDTILADVRHLDPTAAALLDDPDLLAMVLPALRADYAATLAYRYLPGTPLDCPVHVLTGDRDPKVTVAEAPAWAGLTTGESTLHTFDGDHFFFVQHTDDTAQLIKDTLRG